MMSTKNCRKGFTIIEGVVASALMGVLALILSSAWGSVGKATVDLIARVQLAQEMDFAAAALSRDLGGCVANFTGQSATFPIVRSATTFITPTGTDEMSSSIQWILDNNDEITYELDTSNPDLWKRNNLVRRYHDETESEDTTFTVARNVDGFQASWSPDGERLSIRIDFSCNFRYGESSNAPTYDRTRPIVKRTCVLVTNISNP
jgi:prepilin-type N-terminal cleavage/methylation domain-containing protein